MPNERLRQLLESEHTWPTRYLFKFVVPAANKERVIGLLPGAAVSLRLSKGGRYVSISMVTEMESPDAVLDVYEEATAIEGLIAL